MCYCTILALFHVVSEGNFQVQVPGAYIMEGFFALRLKGAVAYIWRGLCMNGLIFGILRYFNCV